MIFMRSFPEIVLISFLLTIYNLLPLYPLDGGRVLRLMGERSRTVRTAASVVEIIFLACLLWVFVFWHTAVPLFPVIPYVREKYLAKRRNSGYNRANTEVR